VPQVTSVSRTGRIRPIVSRQSPHVQAFRDLARKRKSNAAHILIEGRHLLGEARAAGVAIERVAFTTDLLTTAETAALAEGLADAGAEVFSVSGPLMQALSPVRTPSGIVAIGRLQPASLEDVFARAPQLVLIAADVQDPGNVGAMVRATEAAGGTGFVACGASADAFGWKAIRGSMGSAFRLPIARATLDEALTGARKARLQVLAAVPRMGQPLFELDLRPPTAVLLGGEGPGLSLGVLEDADSSVSIPMRPPVESLNVAVAAALVLYEALRQRSTAP